jgi:hypothetical protein
MDGGAWGTEDVRLLALQEGYDHQWMAPQGPVAAPDHPAFPQAALVPAWVPFPPVPGRVLGQEEIGILPGPSQDEGGILLDDNLAKLEFRGSQKPGPSAREASSHSRAYASGYHACTGTNDFFR